MIRQIVNMVTTAHPSVSYNQLIQLHSNGSGLYVKNYLIFQAQYEENFVEKAQLDRIKLDIEAKVVAICLTLMEIYLNYSVYLLLSVSWYIINFS